ELIERWLSSIQIKGPDQGEGLAPATFAQYESIAKHQILPYLGKMKLRDLNRTRIDSWLKTLQTTTYVTRNGATGSYSANTLRLCRVVLSAAVKWATREKILAFNPVRDSRPPGGRPRAQKHAMDEGQARQLIEKTRGTELGALWALMITTGLRRGEALGLRWQDFDGESVVITSQIKLENGKIVRGDLKTERSKRSLRVPKFLVADLETHRVKQQEYFERLGKPVPKLIFPNSNGNAIRPDNLRKRFLTALQLAGIEPHDDGRSWTVHELRHTAASQLLNDRMPVQIVSRALGHSSVRVTIDVYAHLSDKDSEILADSMESRYGLEDVTE
ncbi:MAG: site-specific integrase, partial [Actinomycetota bacterium]